MMHMKGLTHEYPLVRVNTQTWDVQAKGSFQEMNKRGQGHLMTLSLWKQITEERGIAPKDLTQ